MSATTTIQHKGFIESISENEIKVKFTSLSACAECHAKGLCSASDMKDKELILKKSGENYKVGDRVDILMTLGQGSHAVLLGYVYPFFLFLFSLLVLSAAGLNELQAGIISLFLLFPYYTAIYFFRKKINQKFNFSIRKES
ncbi:MAG: SoxR reducing system RseC family protein [Bacteroidota bacterium]